MLDDLTPAQREQIVGRLSADEEPYVFENLIELHDRSIQLTLREIQSDTLVEALLPASMALRNKILRNLSSAAAQMLAEDIEARGPVPVATMQAAQQEIIGIALQKFSREIEPYIEGRSAFQSIYYRLENLSANERHFVSAALTQIEAETAAEGEMVFDDLESLDEAGLKCLLDQVPHAWLVDALKSCSDGLRQKLLLNLPPDRAAALQEVLDLNGQAPILRCAAAQEKIIYAAYRLINEGRIERKSRTL